MRQYIPRWHAFLNALLSLEAMPQDLACCCCSMSAMWRCLYCLGRPVYCAGCCRDSHSRLVFHRVEHWTGSYWEPTWLRQAGAGIHLGHGGRTCPPEASGDFVQRLDDNVEAGPSSVESSDAYDIWMNEDGEGET